MHTYLIHMHTLILSAAMQSYKCLFLMSTWTMLMNVSFLCIWYIYRATSSLIRWTQESIMPRLWAVTDQRLSQLVKFAFTLNQYRRKGNYANLSNLSNCVSDPNRAFHASVMCLLLSEYSCFWCEPSLFGWIRWRLMLLTSSFDVFVLLTTMQWICFTFPPFAPEEANILASKRNHTVSFWSLWAKK